MDPPGLTKLIAGDSSFTLDLTQVFADPDGEPLSFSATSSDPVLLTAEVTGATLELNGSRQGEANVFLQADDGKNPPVGLNSRVLIYPAPFPVATENFAFNHWSSNEPAGSYPQNMLFLQGDGDDPGLEEPLLFAYHIPEEDAAAASDVDFPYAATSRTRINGHGAAGISFVNTGRGRDLGAALLALDTTQATEIDVVWTAGTVSPNTRIYGIRLQSRVGISEPWTDVMVNNEPVEYVRQDLAGETILGAIRLPESLEGQPYVQLRWKYYHISGASGSRAQLRLDDIAVSAVYKDTYDDWVTRAFVDPADRDDAAISGPGADPRGEGVPNLLRYALEIDPAQPGRTHLPRAEADDGRLSLLFYRSAAKSDVVYRVEASSDLADWSEILYDSRTDPRENTDGDLLRVHDSISFTGGGTSRFLRLRILETGD